MEYNIKKYLQKETYLNVIKESNNSKMFQSAFAIDNDGNKIDMLNKGEISCAFYVSSILKIFNLIDNLHLTVISTIKDMKNKGWIEIADSIPDEGDVLLWEQNLENKNKHLGFYVEDEIAISNSTSKQMISLHHYTYENKRKIENVFRWMF